MRHGIQSYMHFGPDRRALLATAPTLVECDSSCCYLLLWNSIQPNAQTFKINVSVSNTKFGVSVLLVLKESIDFLTDRQKQEDRNKK